MKQGPTFEEAVESILKKDNRFALDAYLFVRDALDCAARIFEKPTAGPGRHVSGQELLEAVRVLALQEFGPLALRVLNSWGLKVTDDVGSIVFNLIESEIFSKTDRDRREDFAHVYRFEEVFVKPFLPPSQVGEDVGGASDG